ncbi:hypothetical protein MKZ38_005108 [Zalerion maritima]|uniref:Uncharacterized protein n=1 Tax=Zalerion maritima TaxID=339359 RepID=A0AAD5WQH4_9PEZI|nr:hypothetical protein MKZ38_005108 [Zalerion maritima]
MKTPCLIAAVVPFRSGHGMATVRIPSTPHKTKRAAYQDKERRRQRRRRKRRYRSFSRTDPEFAGLANKSVVRHGMHNIVPIMSRRKRPTLAHREETRDKQDAPAG